MQGILNKSYRTHKYNLSTTTFYIATIGVDDSLTDRKVLGYDDGSALGLVFGFLEGMVEDILIGADDGSREMEKHWDILMLPHSVLMLVPQTAMHLYMMMDQHLD